MVTTTELSVAQDDVEGLDDPSIDGWGDYPLDAVFVRTEQRSVSEVVRRIESHRYVLDPDFQRDFVWPTQKQSKLIESCIMRIPLPVFYVAEAPDGRIIVVDGLQRLTTFARFMSNQFRLTGLHSAPKKKGNHPLEGRTFEELSISLQERVLDTQLTMYILDAKAPERARLDIFERVNSGEPLTRQQMRNALYNGPATTWLKDAANSVPFKIATGEGLNPKTMRDREAINRFCAFRLLGQETYTTGDMDGYLALGLNALASLSEDARRNLRDEFDQSMDFSYALFGEHSFRKSLADESPYATRTVINISLFEALAVALSKLPKDIVQSDGIERVIRDAITSLFTNEVFMRSITYSTNSTSAVKHRFTFVREAIEEAINAYSP